MLPELVFSFRIAIRVDRPTIVSNDPQRGKRQLIPIREGVVTGEIDGTVLPGGVDSQIIQPDGICRLSARYAIETVDGARFYVENNGLRRIPALWRDHLFTEDMGFFNQLAPEEIYFKAVPTFEVFDDRLSWLTDHLFICSAERTPDAVTLEMYRVV